MLTSKKDFQVHSFKSNKECISGSFPDEKFALDWNGTWLLEYGQLVPLETIIIGLERRRFALPQKFVSLHSIDLEAAAAAAAANAGSLPGVVVSGACGGGRGQAKQSSIGFFYPPQLQEGKFTITHTYKLVTVGVVINLILRGGCNKKWTGRLNTNFLLIFGLLRPTIYQINRN